MGSIFKNTFVVVGILVIAVLGYYLFVIQKDSELQTDSVSASEAKITSEQFLQQLNLVKTIDLSSVIFTDARFQSLQNFSTPVRSEPIGKRNPFTR